MTRNSMNVDRGIANRGIDDNMILDANREILPSEKSVRLEQVRTLNLRERAIVDEAFLRGASIENVIEILIARELPKSDIGVPIYMSVPGLSREKVAPGGNLGTKGVPEGYSFTEKPVTAPASVFQNFPEWIVARTPQEAQRYLALAESRINTVEALLPFVFDRYNAYISLAKREFVTLNLFVQESFKPIRTEPCPDPISIASPEDKYRVMRGAYYRAGYTHIKEDVLRYIEPTSFFGVKVIGGTHRSLKELLVSVEAEVKKKQPGIANQVVTKAPAFVIGGFVPRFQCGTNILSNHAFGQAIDIDYLWNPQLKNNAVISAFQRATGERMDGFFEPPSRADSISKIYEHINRLSEKLKVWLGEWLPKFEQLEAERSKYKSNSKEKAKIAAIDKELKENPDLNALKTLIDAYQKPTVQSWRFNGITTIPKEIIEAFLRMGQSKAARWGGEYENTKDFMHLELLKIDSSTKSALPNQPRRRHSVNGLEDLYNPNTNPIPINGPP